MNDWSCSRSCEQNTAPTPFCILAALCTSRRRSSCPTLHLLMRIRGRKRFFDDPQTLSFVRESRRYRERADLQFLWRDYTDELPIHRGYDLLISQYAGFVSESCKRYLRKGGVLLANNSHGDASLASIDENFRLIAVIQRRGEHFWVSTSRLDEYFVPAKQVEVTRQLLHATKRGIGYKRSASDYVFEKLS
jgi:hypothetical protein